MKTADHASAHHGEISPLMQTLSAYIAEAAHRPRC
jgi:hypothetical protein